ncbi:MAG: DNA-directed RNA polymerase subunit alpha [Rhodospirillales bacterium]|nr:DNA-directed RNA polymerase subunit alpha [Rhodospirillales bacterium]MCY4098378.1 DNA-directed RNA polymerase subunit alpha [Rhodospirillales bacterium]MDE0373558.1 DNA-directed RNA polymerase subunit alpha [Rhodospirillales bacterium]MXX23353.1 DNA-directed RNA polymerase subunit alpha [Rhodospirillales bacterium]MYE18622.1 DNA-directed RNA polymerase subunit alpha [Rhodospirillales bacterium]
MSDFRLGSEHLISPSAVDVRPGADPSRKATLVIEPLERGFGLTLGNALRRVLLSSLPGSAVTAIRIEGVLHEFSSIPGVREDVIDLILNVKAIILRTHSERPRHLELRVKGPNTVTAGMITPTADVEIVNPDLVLCHLDDGAELIMELTVASGKGYVPAAQNRPENVSVGLIPVDAIYSPIRTVAYQVQNTRVGQVTDYDSLSLTVETDGTLTPSEAVERAARTLNDQLGIFITSGTTATARPAAAVTPEVTASLNPHLLKKVEELELSVRAANCLKNDNIVYVGDLVRKTEEDLRKTPNFGARSMNEIRDVLKTMGLSFGMQVTDWPPENIEELVQAQADARLARMR